MSREITLGRIKAEVIKYYKTTDEDFHKVCRNRDNNILPRKMYCYLSRILTEKTCKEIGAYVYKGYDHATVIHHHKYINDRKDMPQFLELKNGVESIIYNCKDGNFKYNLKASAEKIRYYQEKIKNERKFIHSLCE